MQLQLICSTIPNPRTPNKSQITSSLIPLPKSQLKPNRFNSFQRSITASNPKRKDEITESLPSMSEILSSSRNQKVDLKLQTLGPFFRITAISLESNNELGRAEGLVRVWFEGRILHLDSIRLRKETLKMEKSIFGIGLFIGAVAIRHGFDSGCETAQLLAINDSEIYHTKLVRFYQRLGFKPVHEVTGSSVLDMAHMLAWGGIGTRMDASIEHLLIKWCTRFKSSN